MHRLSPASTVRLRAGAGLLALGMLGLTACGSGDDAASSSPAPSSAAATQELPSMDMAPFTLDVPSLDLDKVPGASLAVIQGQDPEYHAAWLQVPGAPAWTQAMDESVRGLVAQYQRDTDRTASPVLDVQPRLAVAGRDVAAARLLSTERRGDRSVSAVHVVWYAAREDRVLSTEDLFTADGWAAFRREVGARMAGDPAVVQDRLRSAVDAPAQVENVRVWDALTFLPDGSALLEVDQAAMSPADAGVLTARIPADTVRPWLSALGVSAQDAARSPEALVLPERPSAAPASEGGDAAVPAPGQPSSDGATTSAPGQGSVPPAPGLPGAPAPGTPGTASQGGGSPGTAPQDTGSQHTGSQGTGSQGTGASAPGASPSATRGDAGPAPTSSSAAPAPTGTGAPAPAPLPMPAPTTSSATPSGPAPAPTGGTPAPSPTTVAPTEPSPSADPTTSEPALSSDPAPAPTDTASPAATASSPSMPADVTGTATASGPLPATGGSTDPVTPTPAA